MGNSRTIFGNFARVYKPFNPRDIDIHYDKYVQNNCVLSVEEVLNCLCLLPEKNDGGQDEILSIFLKRCRAELASPLCDLFNLSLYSGRFPTKWKLNFIIPKFKSGNKNNIKNYRPICKSSYLPKLLDTLLVNKISPCFKHIFIDEQHGFIPKRSVTTNLLTYSNTILESMKNGKQIDTIYTDFKKAFDSVAQFVQFSCLFVNSKH